MNSTAIFTETVTALLSQHKHLLQDLLTNKNFIYFTSAAQKVHTKIQNKHLNTCFINVSKT